LFFREVCVLVFDVRVFQAVCSIRSFLLAPRFRRISNGEEENPGWGGFSLRTDGVYWSFAFDEASVRSVLVFSAYFRKDPWLPGSGKFEGESFDGIVARAWR